MEPAEGTERFLVEVEVANYDDVVLERNDLLAPQRLRRLAIQGLVDCGRPHLSLPQGVAEQLGLRVKGQVKVRYPDGRTILCDEVGIVHLRLLGRDCTFSAVVEPDLEVARIGRIVLTALDLLVDENNRRLVPRDPRYPTCEV